MQTPILSQVVDVLHGLWGLDEAGLFETEPGSQALVAMETHLLDWVSTAPDWMFDPQSEPAAEEPGEVPGQTALPLRDQGGER